MQCRSIRAAIVIAALACGLSAGTGQAVAAPLPCDNTPYLLYGANGGTALDRVAFEGDRGARTRVGSFNGVLNGLGLRRQDGFLYAITEGADGGRVVRIDVTGPSSATFTTLGLLPAIPDADTISAGTVLGDGTYLVIAGTTGYRLDVTAPAPVIVAQYDFSANPGLADVAASPVDGRLYGTSGGNVVAMTLPAGAGGAVPAGTVVAQADGAGYAGAFFRGHQFFGYDKTNANNGIYRHDLGGDPSAVKAANAPDDGRVDAASCPTEVLLTKDAGTRAVRQGDTFTYAFQLDKLGGPQSQTVTFTDRLPEGFTFIGVSTTAGTASFNGRDATVSGIVLPANQARRVAIAATVRVDPAAPIGERPNQAFLSIPSGLNGVPDASVRSDDPDTVAVDDPTAVQVTTAEVDLAIQKTASTATPPQFSSVVFTLAVANKGSRTATGVVVTDELPGGLQVRDLPGTCAVDGTRVRCTLPDVPGGGTAELELTADVQQQGVRTNVATVTSQEADANQTDNRDEVDITSGPPVVDLAITKAAPARADLGDELRYSLAVRNITGPSRAPVARITDQLPDGVTLVDGSLPQGCAFDAGSRTVTCDVEDLASGGPAVERAFRVRADRVGTITNTATVAPNFAGGQDTDASNDSASASTDVAPVVDLAITKAASRPDPPQFSPVRFTLGVRNEGSLTATGVVVTDELPGGLEPRDVPANCTVDGTRISCALPPIPAGGTAEQVLDAYVQQQGRRTNVATVTSVEPDADTTDNRAEVEVTSGPPVVDLAITKSAPAQIGRGNQFDVTLAVRNTTGPSRSPVAKLTDVLPAGMTLVAGSLPPGCTYDAPSRTVTCGVEDLPPGGPAVERTFRVRADADGTLTNTATVAPDFAGGTDTDDTNNSSTATTQVRSVADLGLTKTTPAASVKRGQQLTYSVTVSNAGPSDAANVTMTDDLPDGMRLLALEAPGAFTCTTLDPITCTAPSLAPGGSAVFGITVRAERDGTIANTARVSAMAPDPDPADNTSTATVDVTPVADLSVRLAPSTPSINQGEAFTYTLDWANAGPSPATQAEIVTELPAEVTFDAPNGCTQAGTRLTCALGTAAVGATGRFTIAARATGTGATTATSTISSPVEDPDTRNNASQTAVAIAPSADVAVVKTASTASADEGEELDYVLRVTNSGPSRATGVVVTDDLPPGIELVSAPASCTGSDPVACSVGELAASASTTITLRVRATAAGTTANNAVVVSNEHDPDKANNSSSTSTTQGLRADLSVTKRASVARAATGDRVAFTIEVANAGPSRAAGTTVTDALPDGVELVEARPSTGSCTGTGPVVCALGELAPGARATVEVVVRTTAAGVRVNGASVTSNARDPRPEDDTATATVEVTDPPQQQTRGASTTNPPAPPAARTTAVLTKTANRSTVRAGGRVRWTIAVRNSGRLPMTGVRVCDRLPAGLALVAARGARLVDGQACFTLARLAAGATKRFVVETRVLRGLAARLTNRAFLTAGNADPARATGRTRRLAAKQRPGGVTG